MRQTLGLAAIALGAAACSSLLGLDDDASSSADGGMDASIGSSSSSSSGESTSSGASTSSSSGSSSSASSASSGGTSSSSGSSGTSGTNSSGSNSSSSGALPSGARAAFVTQATVTGDFAVNGAGAPNAWATADALCNQESAAASLPGHFVALISYAGHPANTRLDPGVPYAMYYADHTEGPQIDATAEDMFAHGPDLRVDRFANGQAVPEGNATVWTGADDHGGVDEGTQCDGWTTIDGDEQARTGYPVPVASADSTEWINASLQPCAFPHRLYCFETRD